MRQCLMCCNPLRRIKHRHLTDKVFKDWVDPFPQRKRSPRVLLVKSVPDDAKGLNIWTLVNMFEEPLYAIRVCKVRNLALEDVSEYFLPFTKLALVDGKDDAFVNSVDALRHTSLAVVHYKEIFRTYHNSERENIRKRIHWTLCMCFWAAPHPVSQLPPQDRAARRHNCGIFDVAQLNTLNLSAFCIDQNIICLDV